VQAQVDAINLKQKQILDQQLVEKREKREFLERQREPNPNPSPNPNLTLTLTLKP
jgi:hypothetical protein